MLVKQFLFFDINDEFEACCDGQLAREADVTFVALTLLPRIGYPSCTRRGLVFMALVWLLCFEQKRVMAVNEYF